MYYTDWNPTYDSFNLLVREMTIDGMKTTLPIFPVIKYTE